MPGAGGVDSTSYRVGGDIIVAVNGTPVNTFEQLRDAIAQKKPGDKLSLEIFRHNAKKSITVTLGQAPK